MKLLDSLWCSENNEIVLHALRDGRGSSACGTGTILGKQHYATTDFIITGSLPGYAVGMRLSL